MGVCMCTAPHPNCSCRKDWTVGQVLPLPSPYPEAQVINTYQLGYAAGYAAGLIEGALKVSYSTSTGSEAQPVAKPVPRKAPRCDGAISLTTDDVGIPVYVCAECRFRDECVLVSVNDALRFLQSVNSRPHDRVDL